jgi:antitoxin component YwqK of YwqJK toxin-antitoxin module
MKNPNILYLVIVACLLVSCTQNSKQINSVKMLKIESKVSLDSSVVNYVDSYGRRQGHWKYYNSFEEYQFPNYAENALIKEGYYMNNKKVGLWKFYDSNGKITPLRYKNDTLISFSVSQL